MGCLAAASFTSPQRALAPATLSNQLLRSSRAAFEARSSVPSVEGGRRWPNLSGRSCEGTNQPSHLRRDKMYAIVGITGRVGGAVAENLLAQGEQIRAIVRNPEKAAQWKDRGAEIAVADVDDPNALASAFEGTDGVFLMIPPNFAPAPGFPETRKTLE